MTTNSDTLSNKMELLQVLVYEENIDLVAISEIHQKMPQLMIRNKPNLFYQVFNASKTIIKEVYASLSKNAIKSLNYLNMKIYLNQVFFAKLPQIKMNILLLV